MAKSTRLRLRDVESAVRLAGECGELWADPDAWRGHLLGGACRLAGQAVGHYAEFALPKPGGPMVVYAVADAGWRDEAARSHFVRFSMAFPNPFNAFPEFGGMLGALAVTGRAAAFRQELCPDDQWDGSPYLNEFRRPAFNDGFAVSFRRHGSELCSMLDVSQDLRDPSPTVRTKRLVSLTHRHVAGMLGSRLATERHRGLAGLSPRLREALRGLLDGDGEKQLAVRLGIRPATAHEYVTKLYRHFDVGSRPELMAYFVRRQPTPLVSKQIGAP